MTPVILCDETLLAVEKLMMEIPQNIWEAYPREIRSNCMRRLHVWRRNPELSKLFRQF